MKNKMVIGGNQHGFMERKSNLTNLIAFCDKMTGLMDRGTVMDIFYLSFNKVFGTVSYKILIDKVMKYGLEE